MDALRTEIPITFTTRSMAKKIWVRSCSIFTLCDSLIHVFFHLDVDGSPGCVKSSNKSGVERMLEFGRELFQMSQRLEKENGINETNQKTLEVGVSWSSV